MNNYSITKLPSDILLELSKKHRVIRKQKRWSQEELADRSGVSLGSVKRFEQSGKIALESLLKLVFVLGKLSDFETILEPTENLEMIENLFSNKTQKTKSNKNDK